MWKKTALICLLANSLILCIAGQNFKLPKTTAPLAYTVNINTNIEAILFDGVVTIDIKVLQPTREIILHNQHLDITKLSAYDHCSRSSFQIISNTTLEQSDLYVIGFRDEMTVNCVYELMILYNGRLRINNTGLFLAHYEDGDNFG